MVRLVVALSLATGALVFTLFITAGPAFIDFVSTNQAVREEARDFLVFAALAPLVGAAAFAFDGIYIGATWTRPMRDLMLLSFALYLGVFALTRGSSNEGLWLSFVCFLGVRGIGQALLYPRLSARAFA